MCRSTTTCPLAYEERIENKKSKCDRGRSASLLCVMCFLVLLATVDAKTLRAFLGFKQPPFPPFGGEEVQAGRPIAVIALIDQLRVSSPIGGGRTRACLRRHNDMLGGGFLGLSWAVLGDWRQDTGDQPRRAGGKGAIGVSGCRWLGQTMRYLSA